MPVMRNSLLDTSISAKMGAGEDSLYSHLCDLPFQVVVLWARPPKEEFT